MASLLQDIGTLPLLEKATHYPGFIKNTAAINELLNQHAGRVGASVLRHWGMPVVFQEVAKQREHWSRHHNGEADLIDLILLARIHSYVGQPKMADLPRIDQLPAFDKMNLGELGPNQSFVFLEQAGEAIRDIRMALI